MKIIESNGQFNVYGGNSVSTYDMLPAGYYEVYFHKQKGFWLEEHPQMQVKEEKVYGNHMNKVDKVLKAFKTFNRNLGIMLSGDKGMGKSLFARMLSTEAVKVGLPVIVVNFYAPGIMNFIDSIQQEALILFDEFDKTFEERDDCNPQYEVLNVLDGLSIGKKLFAFICNDLEEINDCMLNRPGRIHYHFRFSYPNEEEIRAYLKDKLNPIYYNQIDDVVKFSCMTNINYDCLRAIAFELNCGYGFKESVNDLNILCTDGAESYCTLELEYANNKKFMRNVSFDLFDKDRYIKVWVKDQDAKAIGEVYIGFSVSDVDMVKEKEFFATISNIELNLLDIYRDCIKEEKQELEKYYLDPENVVMITLRRASDKNKNKRYF